MKKLSALFVFLFTTAFAAAPMAAQPAECSDLEFTGEVGERFPNARDYCIDVAQRDGKPYAHFKAEIDRIRGETVYLKFTKPDGAMGPAVSFTPPPSFRARIDGRSYSLRSLSPGQQLDVWVPENAWELAQHDTQEELVQADQLVTYEIAEADEQEGQYAAAATLPRTASPWPMIGLLGGGMLVLGSLIGIWRRRSTR